MTYTNITQICVPFSLDTVFFQNVRAPDPFQVLIYCNSKQYFSSLLSFCVSVMYIHLRQVVYSIFNPASFDFRIIFEYQTLQASFLITSARQLNCVVLIPSISISILFVLQLTYSVHDIWSLFLQNLIYCHKVSSSSVNKYSKIH